MEELDYDDGQTPLDEDEKDGLILSSITTRGELNEVEQMNIEKAVEWTLSKKFKKEEIFTEKFVRNLHRRMYGDVWKWAGQFRKSEKNIGIDPLQIPMALKQLNDNCITWIQNNVFPEDEISIRYKYELVKIHCFANGNGRHSRLMADIIINHVFERPVFGWGRSRLSKKGDIRSEYLHSLRQADNNNFNSLLEFARK